MKALFLLALWPATAFADFAGDIRAAVAKAEAVDENTVEVTPMGHSDVPRMVVFRAKLTRPRKKDRTAVVGVLARDGKLTTDGSAMQEVMAAWRYGAQRTVGPVRVAAVLGFLEGVRDATHPVLTDGDLAELKPEWRAKAALPKEVVVGGKLGVEYWNRGLQPSLWRTVVLIGSDGKVDLSATPVSRVP